MTNRPHSRRAEPATARADRRTYIGVEQSCKSVSSLAVAVVCSASGALPDPMGDWWGPVLPKRRSGADPRHCADVRFGKQQPSAERPPWTHCSHCWTAPRTPDFHRGCVKTPARAPDCSGRREPISTVARDLCANSDFSPIKPDFSQCSSRRQNDFLVPKLPGAFSPKAGIRRARIAKPPVEDRKSVV